MKPPTRSRSKPSRFAQVAAATGTEPTPPQPERRHRRVLRDWTPAQRQRLLNALKALGRTRDDSSPLDYTALQTRMPKTPANEIQSAVEALQNKLLAHVSCGLRKENQEERSLIKPIERWVEQACRVTGAQEEPILTAFSQMLTICSMEPSSQRSNHPTHVTRTRTDPQTRSPAPQPLTTTDSTARSLADGRTGNSTVTAPCSESPAQQCHDVDFSKIYSYLGEVDSENQGRCVLTAMESAVVLELLMCLPEELHLLDGSELHRHFMEEYEVLSSPPSSTESQMFSVTAECSRRPAAPSGGQTTHTSPASTTCQSDSQLDSSACQPDGQSASTAHLEKHANTAASVESASDRVGMSTNGLGQDTMSSSATATTPTCQSSSTQTGSINLGPSDWEKAGLCPLNPFRVPLKLLARHT